MQDFHAEFISNGCFDKVWWWWKSGSHTRYSWYTQNPWNCHDGYNCWETWYYLINKSNFPLWIVKHVLFIMIMDGMTVPINGSIQRWINAIVTTWWNGQMNEIKWRQEVWNDHGELKKSKNTLHVCFIDKCICLKNIKKYKNSLSAVFLLHPRIRKICHRNKKSFVGVLRTNIYQLLNISRVPRYFGKCATV